jgi:hypothetical protein
MDHVEREALPSLFLVPLQYLYIFPGAFPFGTMFLASLEIIIGLAFVKQSVRKHVGMYLILVGIGEMVFSFAVAFIEGFLICLATMAVGFFISATRTLKPRFEEKLWLRMFFASLGCVLLLLVAASPLVLGVPLFVFGAYFFAVGVAGFFLAKPKQEVPSPKKVHTNRTISIIVIAILLSASLMYYYDLRTRPAYVDYSIDHTVSAVYANQTNTISISCNNWGDRDCSLYLVLRFQNASISSQTEQPYVQLDGRSAKFPFSLQKAGSPVHAGSKTVFFTVDENVTSFSCYLSKEDNGLTPVSGAAPVNSILFRWNETTQTYEMSIAGGFVV